MHTSLSSGFLAIRPSDHHTSLCVQHAPMSKSYSWARMSPTRRLVRPLSHHSTSILLLCQSSGLLSGSWARTSLTTPLLLMYRTVKISDRAAASSGQSILFENGSSPDTSKDVSEICLEIQHGKPSAQDTEFCGLWSQWNPVKEGHE